MTDALIWFTGEVLAGGVAIHKYCFHSDKKETTHTVSIFDDHRTKWSRLIVKQQSSVSIKEKASNSGSQAPVATANMDGLNGGRVSRKKSTPFSFDRDYVSQTN